MYFIRHPNGIYALDYHWSLDQDAILEDLEDLEVLVSIYFGEEMEERGFSVGFLIRNNKEGKVLFFHSHVNELEIWDINKSWDE